MSYFTQKKLFESFFLHTNSLKTHLLVLLKARLMPLALVCACSSHQTHSNAKRRLIKFNVKN